MSDKIFVNFTKYDYDECIRRLKGEIDTCTSTIGSIKMESLAINGHGQGVHPPPPSTQSVNRQLVLSWNEQQVKEWFESNNIDHKIVKEFYPCTGEVLKQLYDMRNDAPEFYFQSLKTNKTDLKNVLEFTNLLKKLFD